MRTKKSSERDDLKALLLLKMITGKIKKEDVAKATGITRQTFSYYLGTVNSEDWKFGSVISACKAAGITEKEFYEIVNYEGR